MSARDIVITESHRRRVPLYKRAIIESPLGKMFVAKDRRMASGGKSFIVALPHAIGYRRVKKSLARERFFGR